MVNVTSVCKRRSCSQAYTSVKMSLSSNDMLCFVLKELRHTLLRRYANPDLLNPLCPKSSKQAGLLKHRSVKPVDRSRLSRRLIQQSVASMDALGNSVESSHVAA
jgi:hypothetical protein